MELSHEAKTILSLCWVGDSRRSHNFLIDGKHDYTTRDGIKYKPTENTYEELIEYEKVSERPFRIVRTNNDVRITGGEIK